MKNKIIFTIAVIGLCLFGVLSTHQAAQSLGGINLVDVKPRILTPNGDSFNDFIIFQFDTSLTGLPIESSILDVSGAKVSGLAFNANEDALIWDGKDDSGNVMPAGIYIYSIKIGKNLATGTVVLAK